jgi:molybdate/tungstate transport system substrate-binding protein
MTDMKVARRGVSTAIVAAMVIVVIAVGVAAYAVSTMSGRTATVTSATTATVTSTSTSVSISVALAPLLSYSADAYAVESTSLLNGFSQSTGVPVAPVKPGGSFADANQIAAGAPDDVFISVALSATGPAYLKNLSSNWAIGFASDQMVLAYSNSTQTSAVTSIVSLANTAEKSNATSDWNSFYTSLTSGSVKVGISNPVSDPAGLRGWLVLEAAGYLYFGGNQQAYVSPLLQNKDNVTGTNAAALVAPLQAGQIQFLFIYKSAAVTDKLSFLTLDSHVNLGNSNLSSFYSKFSYKDSAGTTKGAAIVLCITIPLSAVNTVEALEFVQYVVYNAKALSSYGVQPFATAMLYNNVPPPASIQALVLQGLIVEAGPLP